MDFNEWDIMWTLSFGLIAAVAVRDLKLAKTVGLITGVFLVTWLPFEFLVVVCSLCNSQDVSPAIVFIIKLLQFGNSVINIVIYPVKK